MGDLDELYQRGLVSDGEYAKARARLQPGPQLTGDVSGATRRLNTMGLGDRLPAIAGGEPGERAADAVIADTLQPGVDLGGTLQRASQGLPTAPMDYLGPFAMSAANVLPGPKGMGAAARGVEAVAPQAETAAAKMIRAYHGSPHDFEKFDISKIGTGEGAQAFGHGLYFAENEGVAKSYRDVLAGRSLKFSALPDADNGALAGHFQSDIWKDAPPDVIKDRVANLREQVAADRATAEAAAKSLKESGWALDAADHTRQFRIKSRELAALDKLAASGDFSFSAPSGKMYEVGINADTEHFLHWDKPINEQSPKVQDFIKSQADVAPLRGPEMQVLDKLHADPKWKGQWDSAGEDRAWMHMREMFPKMTDGGLQQIADRVQGAVSMGIIPESATGERVARILDKKLGPEKTAQALREAGIPGIKYFDQGSRGAGEGSHNYVVFDDKTIEILKKYGLAGLGIGGTVAAQGSQDKDKAAQ